MADIVDITAREILDSRGNPTVEVDVTLEDGSNYVCGETSGAFVCGPDGLVVRQLGLNLRPVAEVVRRLAFPGAAVGAAQLRWDAAKRTFANVLYPLAQKGVSYDVQVGPHGSHGSIARVTIADVPEHERDAVAEKVHSILAPFVLRHEIVFS